MVAPLQNKASAAGQGGPPQRGSTSVSKAKPKETLRERWLRVPKTSFLYAIDL